MANSFAFPELNYTQIPNNLFDEWIPKLKEGELRVLLVIMRLTFGWQKRWDQISLSQLEKKTGMCRDAVNNTLKSLIEKRLVRKRKDGTPGQEKCWYTLDVPVPPEEPLETDDESDIDDNSNNSYQSSKTTPTSRLKRPTKETLTKENLPFKEKEKKEISLPREEEVCTTEKEHQQLVKDYGIEKTKAFYKRLSEWKKDTPRSKWKPNDYRSILRWVVDAEEEKQKRINGTTWNKPKYAPMKSELNRPGMPKVSMLAPDILEQLSKK